jgi:Cd2+/Zn2+-exporting ATPase
MSLDPNPKPLQETAHCGCAGGCSAAVPSAAGIPADSDLAQSDGGPVFVIPTMDCPNEENDIRRAVAGIDGIRFLRFQLSARTVSIDATTEALDAALAAIRKAGFAPRLLTPGADGTPSAAGVTGGISDLRRAILALGLAVAAEALDFFAHDTLLFMALGMVLAGAAIWLSGFSTYSKGLAALRRGQLNMNALMGVAVTGAFLIGQWPEAAMVMALYAIAELIEARSVDRARNAIKGLLALTPDTAEVRQADGIWREIPAGQVALDTIVRVKPGARIPLDGRVTAGTSAVNQAPVTGESIPVDKAVGDMVFAGTINETGMLEFRVTAAAANTTLARIIHAVEQAQGTRAPTQRFVDRFAAIYTPAVFAIAVAVALLTPWMLGWSWTQAFYKALVLLVIACPCALVIATPVTVVSGLAAAARRGILIKGGVYLEDARKLRVIALDKTGTITEGKPRLVANEILPSPLPEARRCWPGPASLAGHSDHPGREGDRAADSSCPENAGLTGFHCPWRDAASRHAPMARTADAGQSSPDRGARPVQQGNRGAAWRCTKRRGRSVTLLASQQQVLAIFAVADTIKESSRDGHRRTASTWRRLGDAYRRQQRDSKSPLPARPASTTPAATCCPRTSWRLSRTCSAVTALPP